MASFEEINIKVGHLDYFVICCPLVAFSVK